MAQPPRLMVEDPLEVLNDDECLTLVASVAVGRVAVSIAALPTVFPVNFALYDHRIVFRTGPGTKLDAAVKHEPDENVRGSAGAGEQSTSE